MATVVVGEQKQEREGAEKVEGHEICQEKAIEMLREHGLPEGLLPMKEILEAGYVEKTGYFWVKQKKSSEHVFKEIKTRVWYGEEVSGYIEKKRLRKLQGVKAKELLLWISIVEIFEDEAQHPAHTFFKSSTGLGRWHPTHAFLLQPPAPPSNH